jgi:hypothetical protein
MNFVCIRTKLQAIIAMEMIKQGVIGKPYVFVRLFQFTEIEDHWSVRRFYDQISRLAFMTFSVNQSRGLFLNSAIMFVIATIASITNGKLFLASIDLYPLAMALKVNVFAKLVTFDDGTANIQIRSSSYHSEEPLVGDSVKRKIARWLFPEGARRFCRDRIIEHYTIYPHHNNIVDSNKLRAIKVDWKATLQESDISRLDRGVKVVMLGAVYEELLCNGWKELFDKAYIQCDIYLPHPRERRIPADSSKVIECEAPAEAVISFLLHEYSNKVTLLHFNSSVALSFAENTRVLSVNLLAGC